MKLRYNILIFIGLLFLVPLSSSAQGVSGEKMEKLGQSLKDGNIKALAMKFDQSVAVTILDDEKFLSRAQAAMAIKKFITKVQPTGFEVKHKGSSGGSKYGIGELVTNRGNFRTYIYVKNVNDRSVIQEIRFQEVR